MCEKNVFLAYSIVGKLGQVIVFVFFVFYMIICQNIAITDKMAIV